MNSAVESLLYPLVRLIGFIVRLLPVGIALALGRLIGMLGYYLDQKHKSLAYANLKIAFAKTKKPSEIKRIVKKLFRNFGQNSIELLRLPHIARVGPEKYVGVEGMENIYEGLKKKKGVILLAMHFGSWELSSFIGRLLNIPYKVLAKPQEKFSKLDELLNSYRQCDVISRGRGTREMVESLRNNEVIGMVVDQGGRDGVLVKFFGRQAAMSVGAIKMGLKLDIPICFCVIVRKKGPYHNLIVHPSLDLINTGNTDQDIISNLEKIARMMEGYIEQYPAEYIWFYKIWKYSKESTTVILSDGKVGHLRQSQAVAKMVKEALAERGIHNDTQIVEVKFKNRLGSFLLSFLSFISSSYFLQGRLRYFKWFLTKESFRQISSIKADFVISCGSSVAGVNFLLASDCRAKSIAVLKPGILGSYKFSLVILPEHDRRSCKYPPNVVFTNGAPNLITAEYLKEQTELLLERYPSLKDRMSLKIGVMLGGDSKKNTLTESQAKRVVNQIKTASDHLSADILITTSRRTPSYVENVIQKNLKDYPRCKLMIIANRNNIPEAVGGILGLSDIVVISGDSISMVSEAASSGKSTVVFSAAGKGSFNKNKHQLFCEHLHSRGLIYLVDENNIAQALQDIARNKIKTRKMDDNPVIFQAVKKVI